jgi:carboxypeptidase C (cathepsin A)
MDGTITWAANLNWPYQQQFNSATNKPWTVAGSKAGYYKTYASLTHLIVYQAGHMVPYDQPQNAQDLLYRFISGGFKN